jgi:hypothetical protein
MIGQTPSELQQAIFDRFEIVEDEGDSLITFIPQTFDSTF